MKKTAVVYWSGTGNTEAMAKAVAEGMESAGAQVTMLTPDQAKASELSAYDAIAFGCPAMGAETLEEDEFEPMFTGCESALSGKSSRCSAPMAGATANGMRTWEEDCASAGIRLAADSVTCCEAPDDAALDACRALGKELAK